MLAAAGGETTFALGAEACVADFVIADLAENHGRLFGAEKFDAEHPRVAALAAAVFALPGVAAYAGSARRPAKVNNSVHGESGCCWCGGGGGGRRRRAAAAARRCAALCARGPCA